MYVNFAVRYLLNNTVMETSKPPVWAEGPKELEPENANKEGTQGKVIAGELWYMH
jgi:hypothetical protein